MEREPHLATVGERLRWVREEVLKTTTQGLADMLRPLGVTGASNASVSRYEGGREPPDDYLAAVADLADVRLGWLTRGEQPRREGEPPRYDPESPWAGSLIDFAEKEMERLAEDGFPVHLNLDSLAWFYSHALGARWPSEELDKLDRWRNSVLDRLAYEALDRDEGERAWDQGAVRAHLPVRHDVGELFRLLEERATPVEMAEFKMRGLFGGKDALTDAEREALRLSEDAGVGVGSSDALDQDAEERPDRTQPASGDRGGQE